MQGEIKPTGIVVAGGASRRMGQSKAWIELGGRFLIVRVIEALQRVCDEVLIVANDAQFYTLGVRVVPDEIANTGSLGGLYSGLKAAKNELSVAVACDMPFLNPGVLRFLISLSPGYDTVIPSVRDGRKGKKAGTTAATAKDRSLHPLHAVYRKTCLEPMRKAIESHDLRMISFHDAVRVRIVEQIELTALDERFLSFWNVNTPEELQRARTFVADQGA